MDIRGKYYANYLRRVINRYPINRSNLETGMIIEIKYNSSKKPAKNYLGLLLHKGIDENDTVKLHFLTLEYMQPRYFKDFVKEVGIESSKYFKITKNKNIRKLLMEENNSKDFYNLKIKNGIDDIFKNAYRVFDVNKIITINTIDFKFEV